MKKHKESAKNSTPVGNRSLKQRNAQMPLPEVYEQEYIFWPWGELIDRVATWVKRNSPKSAFVVDYMCGTGYLLNEIKSRRPDLTFAGCSITLAFIEYAKLVYPHLDIVLQDALRYVPAKSPDVTICTGGLHHLERRLQPVFLEKVASELHSGAYFILAEELIRDYRSEAERRRAVLEMSEALVAYIMKAGAPEAVLQAALELQAADLDEKGEYKVGRGMIASLLEPYFVLEDEHRIWPHYSAAFGDFLFVCRRK